MNGEYIQRGSRRSCPLAASFCVCLCCVRVCGFSSAAESKHNIPQGCQVAALQCTPVRHTPYLPRLGRHLNCWGCRTQSLFMWCYHDWQLMSLVLGTAAAMSCSHSSALYMSATHCKPMTTEPISLRLLLQQFRRSTLKPFQLYNGHYHTYVPVSRPATAESPFILVCVHLVKPFFCFGWRPSPESSLILLCVHLKVLLSILGGDPPGSDEPQQCSSGCAKQQLQQHDWP